MNCGGITVTRARSLGRYQISLEDAPTLDPLLIPDYLKRLGFENWDLVFSERERGEQYIIFKSQCISNSIGKNCNVGYVCENRTLI